MNWIKITDDTKIPKQEVICLNIKNKDTMVGQIYLNNKTNEYETDNGVIVMNVTHFCKISYPTE